MLSTMKKNACSAVQMVSAFPCSSKMMNSLNSSFVRISRTLFFRHLYDAIHWHRFLSLGFPSSLVKSCNSHVIVFTARCLSSTTLVTCRSTFLARLIIRIIIFSFSSSSFLIYPQCRFIYRYLHPCKGSAPSVIVCP